MTWKNLEKPGVGPFRESGDPGLVEKQYFPDDDIRKNHKLYVNLTISGAFFVTTRLKIIAATFQKHEKTRFDELYIYVDKNFLLK